MFIPLIPQQLEGAYSDDAAGCVVRFPGLYTEETPHLILYLGGGSKI